MIELDSSFPIAPAATAVAATPATINKKAASALITR